MTNPRSIPKTNWPWPPPGHTTSCAVRTVISALSASHLSQLDDHVGVGLALPGVPQGECGTRGRQAVPLHLAQLDDHVGVGLALPGVPQGECGTRGRQAVPLHLAQLDHPVGVGLALPGVPQGECRTRGRQAVPLHLAQLDHQVDGVWGRPVFQGLRLYPRAADPQNRSALHWLSASDSL
jgi:hypothetical protein